MKFLLDTHLLIWIAAFPTKLSMAALAIIEDETNDLFFSTTSIWEIAIKRSLPREDIRLDPDRLHSMLLENGYDEITIDSRHAIAAGSLPSLHKDPFDRLLIAQATMEDTVLLTSDAMLTRYPGPIRGI